MKLYSTLHPSLSQSALHRCCYTVVEIFSGAGFGQDMVYTPQREEIAHGGMLGSPAGEEDGHGSPARRDEAVGGAHSDWERPTRVVE